MVAFGLRPIGVWSGATQLHWCDEYRIASETLTNLSRHAVIPLAAGVIDDLQAAAGGNVSIVVFSGAVNMSQFTLEKILV